MTFVVTFVFWSSIGLLVYGYIGYPALMWLLSRFRSRPTGADPCFRPTVSLIIGAESKHIDLGTVRMFSPGDGGVLGVDTRDVKTTADQVTFRASLKYNSFFTAPVRAAY